MRSSVAILRRAPFSSLQLQFPHREQDGIWELFARKPQQTFKFNQPVLQRMIATSAHVQQNGQVIDVGTMAKTREKELSITKVDPDDFPFPMKRVRFTTCSDLYLAQFVESGGKKRSPVGGISFDVGYIDTGFPEGADRNRPFPTVLCIHGAAGNHKDLAGAIQTLANKGARVLCPNFPGIDHTKMDRDFHYKHTTIENCNFLLDFLQAIKVNKLDLIVAFSAGCYAAVPLAVKSGFPVRGLALLQISGCRPYKAVQPFWLLKAVVNRMGRPLVRKILNPVSYWIMKLTGWKHISSIDYPYIMGLVTTGVPFEGYRTVSAELPFHEIPLLITFSEDDRFMDAEISYEYANIVGLNKDRLMVFDESGGIYRRGAPLMDRDRYLKGIVFQKGGHYAQRREPTATLLNQAVAEIYDHVCRANTATREEHQKELSDETRNNFQKQLSAA